MFLLKQKSLKYQLHQLVLLVSLLTSQPYCFANDTKESPAGSVADLNSEQATTTSSESAPTNTNKQTHDRDQLAASPFKLLLEPKVAPTSGSMPAIALPPGAKLSGLSLSGQARMTQTDGHGVSNIAGKNLAWHARYKLNNGCALLRLDEPALVEVDRAAAFISEHTVAVVHKEENATRFVNLTDHHRRSFRVTFGNHYVDLDPGYELVLVKSTNSDAKAVAVQEGIGWRDMHQLAADGLQIFVYRVSAKDMLTACKIYKQLNASPLEADHRLRDELVKTVAALETMFARKKGPYQLDKPYLYGPDGKPPATAKSKGQPV